MVACPNISETILGLMFLVKSSVAHVCRGSLNRIRGNPDSSSKGLKRRAVTYWRPRGSADLRGEYEAVLAPQGAHLVYRASHNELVRGYGVKMVLRGGRWFAQDSDAIITEDDSDDYAQQRR